MYIIFFASTTANSQTCWVYGQINNHHYHHHHHQQHYQLTATRLRWLLFIAIDLDLIRYVRVYFLVFFACKCILCNRLKCLFDIDRLLGTRLEIWYAILFLTPLGRTFPVDSAAVSQVDLVANDNKREVFGIAWRRLNEELVTPAL
jgi:hypothetical protein